MPSTTFFVTLGTILILWFGGMMVLQGEMSVGELVAFNAYVLMLSNPVGQLTWLVNLAGEAVAGTQRAFEVLDIEPEIQSPPDAVYLPTLEGRVEFRNVTCDYGGERARALEDINLVAEPNQIVALIGPTGAGKTSLVNLVPRFYDASQGSVLVDGHEVRNVDLVSLRGQIGIVLQTSLLFSVTVRENIEGRLALNQFNSINFYCWFANMVPALSAGLAVSEASHALVKQLHGMRLALNLQGANCSQACQAHLHLESIRVE